MTKEASPATGEASLVVVKQLKQSYHIYSSFTLLLCFVMASSRRGGEGNTPATQENPRSFLLHRFKGDPSGNSVIRGLYADL